MWVQKHLFNSNFKFKLKKCFTLCHFCFKSTLLGSDVQLNYSKSLESVTVKKRNDSKSKFKECMDNTTASCLKRKLSSPPPINCEVKKTRCQRSEKSKSSFQLSAQDTKDYDSAKAIKDNNIDSVSNKKKLDSSKNDAEKGKIESSSFPETKRMKIIAKRKYTAPNDIQKTSASKPTSKLENEKLSRNQRLLLVDNKKNFNKSEINIHCDPISSLNNHLGKKNGTKLIHCEKSTDKISQTRKSSNALNSTNYALSIIKKTKKPNSDIKVFQPEACRTPPSVSSASFSNINGTASCTNSAQKHKVNYLVSSNINNDIPLLPSGYVNTEKSKILPHVLPSHVKTGQNKATEIAMVNKLASEKREGEFIYDKRLASNTNTSVFLNQDNSPSNYENRYQKDNTSQNDFEDMEVDDEEMLLSNLQEVRNQASHILNQNPSDCLDIFTTDVTTSKVSEINLQKPKLSTPHCDIVTTKVNSIEVNGNSLKKPPSVIIVVDTNILIASLGFLKQLLKKHIPGFGKPILLLPWVVMQELDYLKNRTKSVQKLSNAASSRAADAIKFIHINLISKSPQFIGQTAIQANEPADFEVECNDDRLLQCCFQTQKRESESLIILLTRDMNLINKALIMGLTAADTMTLWSKLNLSNPEHCLNEKPVSSKESHPNKQKETNATSQVDNVPQSSMATTASAITNAEAEVLRRSHSSLSTTQGGKTDVVKNITICHPKQNVHVIQSKPYDDQLTLAKFESVWEVIFNVKHQVSSILSQGHSHSDFSAAVEMCKKIYSLLLTLKQEFERCLLLSPIILCDHMSDFDQLCASLNLFYNEAHLACTDPCGSVTSQQLIHYFKEGKNRSTLSTGLKQLEDFIRDYQNLKNSVNC
ncbi:hypothetical protein Btru_076404 [Bulinus truncatus]|nr:hypothetical protein Btru_076404 [Bulinus truncatus]